VNDKMMKCLNDKINILDFWQARIRIRAYKDLGVSTSWIQISFAIKWWMLTVFAIKWWMLTVFAIKC